MTKRDSRVTSARRNADGTWSGDPDAVRDAMESEEASRERARRWPQTPQGHVDTRAAMTVLARSFPTLRSADGVAPWDPDRFLAWLSGPVPGSGAAHAGRFVLSVWNSATDWAEVAREKGIEGADERLQRFDLVKAASAWDPDHRLACMVWLEAPFSP